MKSKFIVFLYALWVGQATAMMLPNHELKSYHCETCEALSHVPLNRCWAVGNITPGHVTLHKQESVKYHQEVTLAELQKGVSIYTQAPGAVIRIVRQGKSLNPFTPKFSIKKEGIERSLNEASSLWAENEALQNSVFANELTAIQLKAELGSGEFILSEKSKSTHSNERFMIHVLDKASSTMLSLETDKAFYQYGDELVTTIRLHDNYSDYPIDTLTAYVISPDGEVFSLTTEKVSNEAYKAYLKLNSEKNPRGKNWYVEAEVTTKIDEQTFKRHAHTAFSYGIPSAAITELKALRSKPYHFSVGVNVATGSRYALQATLFATTNQGRKEAIESAQSAAWLPPGQSEIVISFAPEIANRYKAPYYLGSFQLIDYGQLKTVDTYKKSIDISKLG
jgi:hypothetical protein